MKEAEREEHGAWRHEQQVSAQQPAKKTAGLIEKETSLGPKKVQMRQFKRF